MQLLVLFVSLCVAAISCAPPEMSPEEMQTVLECMKEHDVQMAELENFNADNPSKKQLCMGGCAATKFGFPGDMDKIFKKFSGEFNAGQQVVLRECYSGITSTDHCRVGQEMMDCEGKAKAA